MKDGMTYEQKDIILIPFPYSDLTGSKQRPAIIISNEIVNKTEDRICCLITSKEAKDGIFIGKEFLEFGSLPLKSWVKPYRIFTVDQKIIRKKLCSINDKLYKIIEDRIKQYIEL